MHSVSLGATCSLTLTPSESTQDLNRPPNKFTPMMLKTSQKTRQTSRTLKMAGIAWINAFTTTCEIRTFLFCKNQCNSISQWPFVRNIIVDVKYRNYDYRL